MDQSSPSISNITCYKLKVCRLHTPAHLPGKVDCSKPITLIYGLTNCWDIKHPASEGA